jgi:hypothetical protein
MDQHLGYKEKHQDFVADLRKAGHPIGDVCRTWIEQNYLKNETYQIYRTEKYPSKAAENRRVYSMLADQVKQLRESVRSTRDASKPAPVIIDCDGLVPWEHSFNFLSELQRRGIQDIEWAGNPRFDRYYGPVSGN